MAEKYYSILTNRGKELEAQSSVTGKPVIIKDFVVGDGNGQAVMPDPAQTKLVREVYRNAISALQVSPDQANQFFAQLVLPVGIGGFVVREVGLLTDAGELYSVANSAAIEKPENGVSVNLQYRLAVSETANIELKVATGDGLFLRIDKNLSEIAAKGEAAQKSSREAIGVLDATTSRKGLVQLSSVTNSSSEALAATPKAVKEAYDLANGKYTAQNATTAQKGIVQLSSAIDSTSETLAATPKAVKAANDNANGRVPAGRKINGHALTSDTNVTSQDIFNGQAFGLSTEDLDTLKTPGIYYQPANANASVARHYPETNAGTLLVYKNAGVTQVYLVYNSSRTYTRSQYSTGAWTAWAKQYDTANKPTAGDVGALPLTGGTLNGNLTVKNTIQIGSVGSAVLNIGDNDSGLRSSKDGQVDFWANSKVMGYWNGTTFSFTGQIIPTNYSNFDGRYYTKAQSDGRYQPKGSYTPAGQAYTKAESDARFQRDTRLGARNYQSMTRGKMFEIAGNVITGLQIEGQVDGDGDYIVMRPLQKQVNGTWYTVAQA
ncbi:phage tail protein [Enterobacter cloacae complex sp. P40RS]|uniref:Phage tail protein n=1 Tax=Enterobacter pasteurii TaxID=3029761 RepID=A0ABR9QBQ7_9ENTR|nr:MULTISPECIES: tail fiber protein [Enterobacter cloacae complex]MBE4856266.1 phage tail protein [Enterobacter pasteurii]MBE4863810.1 phage tail protein [Enterobacter cloacae complex sp. P40C2]MBE4875924.1 phage tail protein [Enterobacter cloacae complex sp. P40C]